MEANKTQTKEIFSFNIANKTIQFSQIGSFVSQLGTGSVVWDSGKILAKYIEYQSFFSESDCPLRILELGSGCGIVGISCMHILLNKEIKFQLVLSDLPKLLPLIQKNVVRNIVNSVNFIEDANEIKQTDINQTIQIIPLDW